MCGIAGIIGREATAKTAEAMSARLKHRGPDGHGTWRAPGVAIVHRRLAILDPTPAGAQPMALGGHVLPSHRARDRLGIKPFYSRVLPDGIAFASELKALLVLGTPPLDKSAVRDFLFHGYIPAPKTIYQGIAKLPAGHSLTFRDGALVVERYWAPSIAIRQRDRAAILAELDALLRVVVPEHTLSDVPVGVFLSGGMDSALTAYYLGSPRTFTLGFDAATRSEAHAARALAAHLGTPHTDMTASSADLNAALDAIPGLFDEPFGDSAAWSNYLIAGCARRQVKARLSGQAGDEIFAGYPR